MSGSFISIDFDAIVEKIQKNVTKICEECTKETVKELRPEMKKRFEEVFKESMQEFYDAYPRKQYSPRHSLLDIFRTEDSGDFSFELIADGNKMGKDRRGGDLFEKVFMQGYHGGAESGDITHIGSYTVIYTPHPGPGTPHYRKGPYFLSWDGAAAQTTPPRQLYHEGNIKVAAEFQPKIEKLLHQKIQARIGDILS